MLLKGEKIFLRDTVIDDLENWIHWNSVDTEWQEFWDAPWEYEAWTPETAREKMTPVIEQRLSPPETRRYFEICLLDGEHIGKVSSYYIDEEKTKLAIGIDIPPVCHRGKGYGYEAYALFIKYLKDNGINEIYTQTWSGNTPMIKMAEKIGFREVERIKDKRIVNGKNYDALTFILR
jgi:RimJ/RimL family protein N-acetyltransferase